MEIKRRLMHPMHEEKKFLKELFDNTHDVWVKDNRDGSMVSLSGLHLGLLRLGLEYLEPAATFTHPRPPS